MEKPFTNPLALEWLVKADADFVTAKRECRARKLPNYDAAGGKDDAGGGFVQRAEEAVFHHSWRRNSRIMYGKTILGKSTYALCYSGVTRGSNLRVNSYWRIMKNRQVLSKTLE